MRKVKINDQNQFVFSDRLSSPEGEEMSLLSYDILDENGTNLTAEATNGSTGWLSYTELTTPDETGGGAALVVETTIDARAASPGIYTISLLGKAGGKEIPLSYELDLRMLSEKRLFLAGETNEGSYGIFTALPDGAGLSLLVELPGMADEIEVDPDVGRIFVRSRRGSSSNDKVVSYALDGTDLKEVRSYDTRSFAIDPAAREVYTLMSSSGRIHVYDYEGNQKRSMYLAGGSIESTWMRIAFDSVRGEIIGGNIDSSGDPIHWFDPITGAYNKGARMTGRVREMLRSDPETGALIYTPNGSNSDITVRRGNGDYDHKALPSSWHNDNKADDVTGGRIYSFRENTNSVAQLLSFSVEDVFVDDKDIEIETSDVDIQIDGSYISKFEGLAVVV